METKILEQQDVARFHLRDQIFDAGPMQSGAKITSFPNRRPKPFGNRRQAVLGVELTFRPAEMRTQNDFAAFVNDPVDSRKGRADPGIVGDLKGIVQGDIKIGADDDPLAGQWTCRRSFVYRRFMGDPYWSA